MYLLDTNILSDLMKKNQIRVSWPDCGPNHPMPFLPPVYVLLNYVSAVP